MLIFTPQHLSFAPVPAGDSSVDWTGSSVAEPVGWFDVESSVAVAPAACYSRFAHGSIGSEQAALVVAAVVLAVAGDVDKSCHYSTAVAVEKTTVTCAPGTEVTIESCYDDHAPPNMRSEGEKLRQWMHSVNLLAYLSRIIL